MSPATFSILKMHPGLTSIIKVLLTSQDLTIDDVSAVFSDVYLTPHLWTPA